MATPVTGGVGGFSPKGVNLLTESMLNSINTEVSKVTKQMHQDLVTQKSFTYTPSWQKSKYRQNPRNVKSDGKSLAGGVGKPYFKDTGTGKRLFKAFAEENMEFKRGSGMSFRIVLGNRRHLEQMTGGLDKGASLAGLFMPSSRNDGSAGTDPGVIDGKRHGVYKIAFYDELLDHYIPIIKKAVKIAIKKELKKTLLKAFAASLKEATGKTATVVADFHAPRSAAATGLEGEIDQDVLDSIAEDSIGGFTYGETRKGKNTGTSEDRGDY